MTDQQKKHVLRLAVYACEQMGLAAWEVLNAGETKKDHEEETKRVRQVEEFIANSEERVLAAVSEVFGQPVTKEEFENERKLVKGWEDMPRPTLLPVTPADEEEAMFSWRIVNGDRHSVVQS